MHRHTRASPRNSTDEVQKVANKVLVIRLFYFLLSSSTSEPPSSGCQHGLLAKRIEAELLCGACCTIRAPKSAITSLAGLASHSTVATPFLIPALTFKNKRREQLVWMPLTVVHMGREHTVTYLSPMHDERHHQRAFNTFPWLFRLEQKKEANCSCYLQYGTFALAR